MKKKDGEERARRVVVEQEIAEETRILSEDSEPEVITILSDESDSDEFQDTMDTPQVIEEEAEEHERSIGHDEGSEEQAETNVHDLLDRT